MSEKIVTIGESSLDLLVDRDGGQFRVAPAEEGSTHPTIEVEILGFHGQTADVRISGIRRQVPCIVQGTTVSFAFDGEIYAADVVDKGARTKPRHKEHSMAAPMPGVVLKVGVAVGDRVQRGAPLLILEAMKMEHQITAPYDGTVKAIHCAQGEMVQPGVELIEVEKTEE